MIFFLLNMIFAKTFIQIYFEQRRIFMNFLQVLNNLYDNETISRIQLFHFSNKELAV